MAVITSRIFRRGNSEALRLPREVAFGEALEVTIVRSGDVLTIYPKPPPLTELMARLGTLPAPRDIEIRDGDLAPERPGLRDPT